MSRHFVDIICRYKVPHADSETHKRNVDHIIGEQAKAISEDSIESFIKDINIL